MEAQGHVIVVSAPSGGGKGTILGRMLEKDLRLTHTVSATTRPPRDREQDGKNYRFLDRSTFERMIAEDAFLEWAEVHGCLYGTPRRELEERLASGRDVVLELDVQGMRSVRKFRPGAVSIFIMPPSLPELERRLRARGDLAEDQLALRLGNAEREIAAREEYDHIVYNDDLNQATRDFERILGEIRAKSPTPATRQE